jgi:hypothetical protein
MLKLGIARESAGGEVQKLRGDDAAVAPDFRDRGDIKRLLE